MSPSDHNDAWRAHKAAAARHRGHVVYVAVKRVRRLEAARRVLHPVAIRSPWVAVIAGTVTRLVTWGSRRLAEARRTTPTPERATPPERPAPVNLDRMAAAVDSASRPPLAAAAQVDQLFAAFDTALVDENLDRDDPVVAGAIIFAAGACVALAEAGVPDHAWSVLLSLYGDYLHRGPR